MAIRRPNPIGLEILQAEPQAEDLPLQVENLVKQIEDVDFDLLGWLRKQGELVRLRRGHRRRKNTPWRNASNISVPLIDGIVRRWKPGIAALILDADPVAFFTAQEASDIDLSRQVEPFFTWLFQEAMSTTESVVQLADLIAWRGHAYAREGWDYRTRLTARVVNVDDLFPQGVENFLLEATAVAEQRGDDVTAVELIQQQLAQEYDLDVNLPDEFIQTAQAAQAILEGARFIKLKYRVVVRDLPKWEALDPINVIVPQDQEPETAEFFTIIHMLTEDQFRSLGVDGHLPLDTIEFLIQTQSRTSSPIGSGTTDNQRSRIKDLLDEQAGRQIRQSEREVGMYTVWEVYCHLDVNGDGEREKCILWYAPEAKEVIALLDYPYPFESWPITYFPFEAAKRPVDNRGIADMLKTFQRLVNAYHNARIDASQIVLAPVLLARLTGGNLKKAIQWRPGSIIPVQSTQDVLPLQHDLSILGALLQEEQVNQRLAETYVGVFDATLTNLSQSRERRTAAEVNAIQSISGSIFGLDAKIFQVAMSRSFTKVWQLYVDFGPKEVYFRVQNEEFPRVARKAEIGRNFDIRASGTPANTNRALQLGNMERIMQIVFNPVVLQSGRIDFAELIRQMVNLIDPKIANTIIRAPEEANAVQQVLSAAQMAGQLGLSQGGEPSGF